MSNWETKPLAGALTGTETGPCNQSGITKYLNINMIKAFIGSAFEAAGAVAAGIAAHLAAFSHANITHSNRTALDAVIGTNTGDHNLGLYATLAYADSHQFSSGILTAKTLRLGTISPATATVNLNDLALSSVIICEYPGAVTLVLGNAALQPFRTKLILAKSATIITTGSTLTTLIGGTTTTVCSAKGKWVLLQASGFVWRIIASN